MPWGSDAMTNSTTKTVISVENLIAAYGTNVIIDDISFKVNEGEVFIILGGSGCGKSTLLKHMIGLYKPAAGKIMLDGDDIVTAEGEKRKTILKRIGVTYQSGALFGSMNILENNPVALRGVYRSPSECG